MAAEKPRLAVLASGSGSTIEAFIEAQLEGIVDAQVALVVCNNPESPKAKVYGRIRRLNREFGLGIRMEHIGNTDYPGGPGANGEQTLEAAQVISGMMHAEGVRLGVLMGFMKKIRGDLLDWPLLNTPPGILPETAGLMGKDASQRVLNLGLSHNAQTLHWVTEEYDAGDKVAEHLVRVLPGDDAQKLFDRVQRVEKAHLPIDVDTLLKTDERFAA